MDPDANLADQLWTARNMLENDSESIDTGDAVTLAELVIALDEWITNGGFIPERWNKPLDKAR